MVLGTTAAIVAVVAMIAIERVAMSERGKARAEQGERRAASFRRAVVEMIDPPRTGSGTLISPR